MRCLGSRCMLIDELFMETNPKISKDSSSFLTSFIFSNRLLYQGTSPTVFMCLYLRIRVRAFFALPIVKILSMKHGVCRDSVHTPSRRELPGYSFHSNSKEEMFPPSTLCHSKY